MISSPQGRLTPADFSFATPTDLGDHAYQATCQAAGLEPIQNGYGLLHATDENGARWTLASPDVDYLRALVDAAPAERSELALPAEKFLARPGWPGDWF